MNPEQRRALVAYRKHYECYPEMSDKYILENSRYIDGFLVGWELATQQATEAQPDSMHSTRPENHATNRTEWATPQGKGVDGYAIALQRAIEHHCRGKLVPEMIASDCPHHAKMLNESLAPSPVEKADYVMVPSDTVERRAEEWRRLDEVIKGFIDDYEFLGEDDRGIEGYYTPSEQEKLYIRDCLEGLLAHDDFLGAIAATYPIRSKFSARLQKLCKEILDSLPASVEKIQELTIAYNRIVSHGGWISEPTEPGWYWYKGDMHGEEILEPVCVFKRPGHEYLCIMDPIPYGPGKTHYFPVARLSAQWLPLRQHASKRGRK